MKTKNLANSRIQILSFMVSDCTEQEAIFGIKSLSSMVRYTSKSTCVDRLNYNTDNEHITKFIRFSPGGRHQPSGSENYRQVYETSHDCCCKNNSEKIFNKISCLLEVTYE